MTNSEDIEKNVEKQEFKDNKLKLELILYIAGDFMSRQNFLKLLFYFLSSQRPSPLILVTKSATSIC